MSNKKRFWVNNQTTNIVIINSGDGNHQIIERSMGGASPSANQNIRREASDAKFIVDIISSEGSEDRTHNKLKDMSPHRHSGVFGRSNTYQNPAEGQYNTENNPQTMMSISRWSQKGIAEPSPLNNWKNKMIEDDPFPEVEPVSASLYELPSKRIETKEFGTGRIAPTLGAIGEKNVSNNSIVDEFQITPSKKNPSKPFEKEKISPFSPGAQPRRSLTSPDAVIAFQKKLQSGEINQTNSKGNMNSVAGETIKLENSTIKTEKSFLDKLGLLSSIKKLGSKTNMTVQSNLLDNKLPSQIDVSMENKQSKLNQELPGESTKHSAVKEENKLLNIIMKHAASGTLTKEAEILNRVLKRTQPEKLNQIHIKKHNRCAKAAQCLKSFLWAFLNFFINLHQPDEIFIIVWNFIGLVLVILNCLYVPFVLSFYFDNHDPKVTLIINLYFTANILVKFRTAYYLNGLLIKDQKKILVENLNFSFLLEVLAIIAGLLYLVFEVDGLRYLLFFTLVRVRHIQGLVGKMEDHSYFSREATRLFRLLRLMLVILTIAHVSGCVFHMIATDEYGKVPNNWITVCLQPDPTVLETYVASLYWAFATMITVGYGDIVPTTTNERIYTVFIMAVACGVFGYAINTMAVIFLELNVNITAHKFLCQLGKV